MTAGPGSETRLVNLIGQVYDAALDQTLWAGVAPAIAEAFDASSSIVFSTDNRTPLFLSHTANYELTSLREYRDHYHRADVWAQGGIERGLGAVIVGQEIIGAAAFAETEIYRDWARKLEVFHLVGAVFEVTSSEIGVLGIHRSQTAEAFNENDRRRVTGFLPHLQRVSQMRRRLAEVVIGRDAALEALDRSAIATIVATRDGRVLYANPLAEALLRAGDGLRAPGGRLAAGRRTTGERLAALVLAAADTAAGHASSPGGALAIAREDRLPLTVLVAPFRPARDGFGAALPAAILFVRDPETPTPTGLGLQGLFGLTPTEAGIAAALAEGKSVGNIAARHRITHNTARVHVRNILAKTGTTRQAQLVSLILRSVTALQS